MKSTDQKEGRESWHNTVSFYQAIFSSSSLENVILCPTISSCPLNLYGFPRLPWPTMPRKKASAHRGKSTVSSKSELVHTLTSVKSSFSQSHLCIHTCTHTHPTHVLWTDCHKSLLNNLLCQCTTSVALLVLGEKSEGLRCRGIIGVYIWLPLNQPGKPQQRCLHVPCHVTVFDSGWWALERDRSAGRAGCLMVPFCILFKLWFEDLGRIKTDDSDRV